MSTRKQRGKIQKLYLIECNSVSQYIKEYVVMGSTGRIYSVTIKPSPICSCPDYQMRHRRCKHIYFILLRIMKVNKINKYKSSSLSMESLKDKYLDEDKEKYTKLDIKRMFRNIPKVTNHLLINKDFKKKYDNLKLTGQLNKGNEIKKQRDNNICPICLDDIDNGEILDYCKYSCGNPIHNNCFIMYSKYKKPPICVFCRACWEKQQDYCNLIES